MRFGEYLKSLRAEKRISLREFSRRLEIDPGNLSKIERGHMNPPKDTKVKAFAKILGYDESSPEVEQLLTLASIDRGNIPTSVLSDDEVLEKLPVFFRTVTGRKLEREKMLAFLEELKSV